MLPGIGGELRRSVAGHLSSAAASVVSSALAVCRGIQSQAGVEMRELGHPQLATILHLCSQVFKAKTPRISANNGNMVSFTDCFELGYPDRVFLVRESQLVCLQRSLRSKS